MAKLTKYPNSLGQSRIPPLFVPLRVVVKYLGCAEDTVRRHLLAYMRLLQQAQQREAVAHLASLLEHPKFAKAMSLVAASLEIIEVLTDYIEGIKVD